MRTFDALQARATAAFENDDWSDEQDRSDWFEAEAYSLAAVIDQIDEVVHRPSAWSGIQDRSVRLFDIQTIVESTRPQGGSNADSQ